MATDSRIEKCPSDKPVGAVVMILSVLAWILSLLLASLLSILFVGILPAAKTDTSMVFNNQLQPGFNGQLPPGAFGGLSPQAQPSASSTEVIAGVLAFLIPTVLCVVAFAGGIGIAKSRRWGFGLGIVVFLLVSALGSGAAAVGLAVSTYCVLRLAGVLGGTGAGRSEATGDRIGRVME